MGIYKFLKKEMGIQKERNKGYKHHAEDALIIANADFILKNGKTR